MPLTTESAPDRNAFLDGVRASGVLTDRQFDQAAGKLSFFQKSARDVADQFVDSGVLTRYQAERLLAGRTAGFVVGAYVLLEYAGKSNGGRIYTARHRTMNRLVTIHFLATDGDAVRAEIRRQARAAAKLAHPNVVTLLDVNDFDGKLYLVQEHMAGTDVERLLRSGRISVPRACEYVRQAALGLQHAHEQKIYHGRLGPKAILVGRPGGTGPDSVPVVKVSGLGLGRLTGEHAESGFECLAPEQFADPKRADAAGDIYALGCLFYSLLAGHPPFPADTLYDAARHHTTGTATPITQLRNDIPTPIAHLLLDMMAKKPLARPRTAAAVADALQPYASLDDSGFIDFGLSATVTSSGTQDSLTDTSPWADMLAETPTLPAVRSSRLPATPLVDRTAVRTTAAHPLAWLAWAAAGTLAAFAVVVSITFLVIKLLGK